MMLLTGAAGAMSAWAMYASTRVGSMDTTCSQEHGLAGTIVIASTPAEFASMIWRRVSSSMKYEQSGRSTVYMDAIVGLQRSVALRTLNNSQTSSPRGECG